MTNIVMTIALLVISCTEPKEYQQPCKTRLQRSSSSLRNQGVLAALVIQEETCWPDQNLKMMSYVVRGSEATPRCAVEFAGADGLVNPRQGCQYSVLRLLENDVP